MLDDLAAMIQRTVATAAESGCMETPLAKHRVKLPPRDELAALLAIEQRVVGVECVFYAHTVGGDARGT
jgi:hypothetical protein